LIPPAGVRCPLRVLPFAGSPKAFAIPVPLIFFLSVFLRRTADEELLPDPVGVPTLPPQLALDHPKP